VNCCFRNLRRGILHGAHRCQGVVPELKGESLMSKSSRPIYAFILAFNLILTTVTAQQKPSEDKIDVILQNWSCSQLTSPHC
jgi:hypothetical protein